MRRSDLPEHLLTKHGKYIASAEVFPSPDKIYLYVESIKNKCVILPIDEYAQLGITNDLIFFSRASYDPVTKNFKPETELWKSDCCSCH